MQADCTPKQSRNSKPIARARVTASQAARATDSRESTVFASPPPLPTDSRGLTPSQLIDSTLTRLRQNRRAERYYLQAAAREIRWAERESFIRLVESTFEVEIDRRSVPEARVCLCHRRLFDASLPGVEIWRKRERSRFGNLISCGSPWDCPVCSNVISLRRRDQVEEVVTEWWARGNSTLHLVLTLQHERSDSLYELVYALNEARRYLRAGAPYQRIKARYGITAEIAAAEQTIGAHGWHPHAHVLIFTQYLSDSEITDLQGWIYDRWLAALARHDRWAAADVGVWLKRSTRDDIDEYLTKVYKEDQAESAVERAERDKEGQWGLADEITGAGRKRAKKGAAGLNPLDLLAWAAAGHGESRRLWLEFANTMFGRQQLTGLADARRAILGIAETESDETLAADVDQDDILSARITLDGWRKLLRLARAQGVNIHDLLLVADELRVPDMTVSLLESAGSSADAVTFFDTAA